MSTIGAQDAPMKGGRWPGEAAVWSMLCSDLIVFSVMFVAYAWDRLKDVATFTASQRSMNEAFGLTNTVLLLLSSWFVAGAVRALKSANPQAARHRTLWAMACGCGFVAVKILEYREKIAAGVTPQTDLFYTYYFMVTGIHLAHLLIGLLALGLLTLRLSRPTLGPKDLEMFESGASFWHLVDLVWIMIFALFYLAH